MKKRKLNYKNIAILVLIISLALLIFLNLTRIRLTIKGYSQKAIGSLLNLTNQEIDEYLKNDTIYEINEFDIIKNNHHYIDYNALKDEYNSPEEIIDIVDQIYLNYQDYFINNNFTLNEIHHLIDKVNYDDFKFLKKYKLDYDSIKPFINQNGCVIKDIPLYLESSAKPSKAIVEISHSQIDSRNDNNDDAYIILEPEKIDILVKDGYILPKDYVPNDLVEVNILNNPDNDHILLRKEAALAIEKMANDAAKEDLYIANNSAYRSYKDQIDIYNEYFEIYDSYTASRLVAKPGSSEHQLGLAIDLTSKSVIDGFYGYFGATPEFNWCKENAHKYGFILRYNYDKTEITGVANEPWHFRYVGKDLAHKLYKNNLSLEEYILNHGFTYKIKSINH